MSLTTLNAISPIDGRYRRQCEELAGYFSEAALIKARVFVEAEYFIALCQAGLPQLASVTKKDFEALRKISSGFSETDALSVKATEKITNHDVKAVEYFLKEKAETAGLGKYKEFIHFGLTSQDINNTAQPLILKKAVEEIILPALQTVVEKLNALSKEWAHIPMLARTHGQPASPTMLGKEIYVFSHRLQLQINEVKKIPFTAKFGGATGNFNAHHVAFLGTDWIKFADSFIASLGLQRSQYTTQIEHYDFLAALLDNFKRINTILIDLCRDVWAYISINYFTQQVSKAETGSSAMPHKVNPIDFENAEGNLGMANALFEHLSGKLPISRLQRDLTDSTVLRNLGVPFAHSLIACKSLLKGLSKIAVNQAVLENDLQDNYAVVAEAIQTILRRENYPNPFEALKELTRTGEKISEEKIKAFILGLSVPLEIKNELLKITPFNYTGVKQV